MNYTSEQLENWMMKYSREAAELGSQWAVKQGELNSLDDRRHDFLARIAEMTEGSSAAEKERKARLNPEWENFRDALSTLKKEALVLKIQFETAKRRWETARSLLSTKNTERRTST